MKTILSLALISLTLFVSAAAAADWQTDYEKALKSAKMENKAVLLNFTGSDWCSWCKTLKKNVFSKAEFGKFARENLVLVELDWPRQKNLPEEIREQNDRLASQYDVKGLPTVILLDSDGRTLGGISATAGESVGDYIASIEKLTKSRSPAVSGEPSSPSRISKGVVGPEKGYVPPAQTKQYLGLLGDVPIVVTLDAKLANSDLGGPAVHGSGEFYPKPDPSRRFMFTAELDDDDLRIEVTEKGGQRKWVCSLNCSVGEENILWWGETDDKQKIDFFYKKGDGPTSPAGEEVMSRFYPESVVRLVNAINKAHRD